ncbi:MAG: YbjN domain-containing protein [Propionibacteriaceae bacterium]|jgi:hypothetical protein|nr:YbjN domain-containing protein [Propionibacteriaceae bacterium]
MSPYRDFDLDRSTEQSWGGFSARLAEVLSMMDATEPLTLSTHDGDQDLAGYVKFIASDREHLMALIPGNTLLPDDHQLAPSQVEALLAAGWQQPNPTASDETADHLWRCGSQAQSSALADQATEALRDIFGVHHPVFLATDVLAEILQTDGPPGDSLNPVLESIADVRLADLLADIHAIMPSNASHLRHLVERVLTQMPEITPMQDADGDFAIRVGSAMIFVRVPADGLEILVFAPVVHDVDGRSRATEILNDINSHSRWVRFALLRDRVFVMMSILARPFVSAHLRQAIAEVGKVADGVDDLLAQSLHGRTTFSSE